MKTRILSLLLLLIPGVLTADPFTFKVDPAAKPAKIEILPYFFIHQVNFRLIEVTGLGDRLNMEDRIHIVSGLLNLMSYDAPGVIEVPNFQNGKPLQFSFQLKNVKGYPTLVVSSNLSTKDGTLTKTETADTYATMFHIIHKKAIHYSQLYSAETEKQLEKGKRYVELADMYIMDERSDNDNRVRGLLDQVLKNSSSSPLDRFSATLSRGQVEMAQRRLDSAKEMENQAKKILEGIKDEGEYTRALQVLHLYSSELELMKLLHKMAEEQK